MQEARGTARALRDEVSQLTTPPTRQSDQAPAVETMLDALDGTIEMLSELETQPTKGERAAGKDRRGRIDLAALLVDMSPNVPIGIEPGAGTEVSGTETELRRMLNVLIGTPGSTGSSGVPGVTVRREDDWVLVSVPLGPEGAAPRALEHRWLNRMAVRMGGKVELLQGRVLLSLPADSANEKREIQQLRNELEQAQQLGAVYARELAEAFAITSEVPSTTPPSPARATERLQVLVAIAAPLLRSLRSVTDGLRQDAARLARSLGDGHQEVSNLMARTTTLSDLASELERITQVTTLEAVEPVGVHDVVRLVLDQARTRGSRHGVGLDLSVCEEVTVTTQLPVLRLLLRALLDQAIQATPKGQRILVSLHARGRSAQVTIRDGGPGIPESSQIALLRGAADPSALGRPGGLSWVVAGAAADALGAYIEIGEAPDRAFETRVLLHHG